MRSLRLAATLLALLSAACGTETPTSVVVQNGYSPTATPSQTVTVYDLWYVTTLFRDPIAPGAASDPERTIPGSDYAYAVLAVGGTPMSSVPPAHVIALRSKSKLAVERGDTLRIDVSDATFDGDCAASDPLSQADADFITQRIFPGDFAGSYDAASCALRPKTSAPSDAGRDGSAFIDVRAVDAARD